MPAPMAAPMSDSAAGIDHAIGVLPRNVIAADSRV